MKGLNLGLINIEINEYIKRLDPVAQQICDPSYFEQFIYQMEFIGTTDKPIAMKLQELDEFINEQIEINEPYVKTDSEFGDYEEDEDF